MIYNIIAEIEETIKMGGKFHDYKRITGIDRSFTV